MTAYLKDRNNGTRTETVKAGWFLSEGIQTSPMIFIDRGARFFGFAALNLKPKESKDRNN